MKNSSVQSATPPVAAAHTPTPWSYVKENPVFGKDRCWGFIKSDACRHVVVGVDEFTRTSFGETETYCGVKIAPHDAAFIVRACNENAKLHALVDANVLARCDAQDRADKLAESHAALVAALESIESQAKDAIKAGAPYATLEDIAGHARAALNSAKEGQK